MQQISLLFHLILLLVRLSVIDRKKALVKLSQGEYVSPEKVENVVAKCMAVANAFVHGDSLQNFVIAFLSLDPLVLPAYACKVMPDKYKEPAAFDVLASDTELHKVIEKDIEAICRADGLNGFEIPKKFHVTGESFEQLDLLTPTFKLKRNVARKVFQDSIERLYK